VGLDVVPVSRDELLDLVEVGVRIAEPRQMVEARKLHELGAGDVLGEISTVLDGDGEVTRAVDDDGGDVDRRKQRADVELLVERHHRPQSSVVNGETLEASHPAYELGVADFARREDRDRYRLRLAPGRGPLVH